MTPVPLELPLRTAEAAELANPIFDRAEHRALTDEVRNRMAARAAVPRAIANATASRVNYPLSGAAEIAFVAGELLG